MTPPLTIEQRCERLERAYTQLASDYRGLKDAHNKLVDSHGRLVRWVEQLARTRRDDGLRRSPQETGEPLPTIELVDPPRGRM